MLELCEQGVGATILSTFAASRAVQRPGLVALPIAESGLERHVRIAMAPEAGWSEAVLVGEPLLARLRNGWRGPECATCRGRQPSHARDCATDDGRSERVEIQNVLPDAPRRRACDSIPARQRSRPGRFVGGRIGKRSSPAEWEKDEITDISVCPLRNGRRPAPR